MATKKRRTKPRVKKPTRMAFEYVTRTGKRRTVPNLQALPRSIRESGQFQEIKRSPKAPKGGLEGFSKNVENIVRQSMNTLPMETRKQAQKHRAEIKQSPAMSQAQRNAAMKLASITFKGMPERGLGEFAGHLGESLVDTAKALGEKFGPPSKKAMARGAEIVGDMLKGGMQIAKEELVSMWANAPSPRVALRTVASLVATLAVGTLGGQILTGSTAIGAAGALGGAVAILMGRRLVRMLDEKASQFALGF